MSSLKDIGRELIRPKCRYHRGVGHRFAIGGSCSRGSARRSRPLRCASAPPSRSTRFDGRRRSASPSVVGAWVAEWEPGLCRATHVLLSATACEVRLGMSASSIAGVRFAWGRCLRRRPAPRFGGRSPFLLVCRRVWAKECGSLTTCKALRERAPEMYSAHQVRRPSTRRR